MSVPVSQYYFNNNAYFNNYNMILNFGIQFMPVKEWILWSRDNCICLFWWKFCISFFFNWAVAMMCWWHICCLSFMLVQTLLLAVLHFYIIWCFKTIVCTLDNFIWQLTLVISWLGFTRFGVCSSCWELLCFIWVYLCLHSFVLLVCMQFHNLLLNNIITTCLKYVLYIVVFMIGAVRIYIDLMGCWSSLFSFR